jgi:hypothetical protein
VTCYSCHRGAAKPEGSPMIAEKSEPKAQDVQVTEKLTADLPTAEELISKYITAVGGTAAIEKITSRKETGTITARGQTFPIEIFNQDPDKQALVRHTSAGDDVTVFDGQQEWSSIPGRPLREAHGGELDAARIDADLYFPLHIKQFCEDLRVEYPEKIGERQANVVTCDAAGKQPVRLYFDEQSGLLVRMVHYLASALGRIPTQIDYSDYRDYGGVRMPFRWATSEPNGIATMQVDKIEVNIPIDAGRFARPAADSKTAGSVTVK